MNFSLNFSASSSLVSVGKTTFNWKLTLSQKQCSIFHHPFQDPTVRFESPTFNIDLFRKEFRYSTLSMSLVMGISDTFGNGGCTNFGPTVFIRNQSSSSIDLAEIALKRKVSCQTGQKLDLFKSDENLINITVKGNEQKKVQSFLDLSNCSAPRSKYAGDFVIFEFDLNMEVFKLVAN